MSKLESNIDINIHKILFEEDENFKHKGCGNAHTHGMHMAWKNTDVLICVWQLT